MRAGASSSGDSGQSGRRSSGAEGFDALYAGRPPWDIGRPQPAFVGLGDRDLLQGRVLDAGCGTGEHALMSAALGLEATGIDLAPTAIELAKRKAEDRGLEARFLVWDALQLPALGEQFDTVLDCGLFHVFDDAERAAFVTSPRPARPLRQERAETEPAWRRIQKSIQVTTAAQASGDWFGDNSYQSQFAQLWGLG